MSGDGRKQAAGAGPDSGRAAAADQSSSVPAKQAGTADSTSEESKADGPAARSHGDGGNGHAGNGHAGKGRRRAKLDGTSRGAKETLDRLDARGPVPGLDIETYLSAPVAVIGSGGFGTTLAVLLASKGLEVNQWVRNPTMASTMQGGRENQKYLPGVKLPLNIFITSHVRNAIERAKIIVLAVPSQSIREVAERMKPHLKDPDAIIVNVAKGIEHDTYKRMSEVLEEVLGEERYIVTLSGPNHAEEIGRGIPGATVVASTKPQCLPVVVEAFSNDVFKAFPHTDVIGVELGGTMKNIVAIATGICDGIGYGDNTRSAIMTMGLSEIIRFGTHLGAKKETFMGLAGLGDLIATCTSKHSRNRHVGEELGRGHKLDDIVRRMQGKVAEGIPATKFVHEYAKANGIDLPLTRAVYQLLFQDHDVEQCVKGLLRLV